MNNNTNIRFNIHSLETNDFNSDISNIRNHPLILPNMNMPMNRNVVNNNDNNTRNNIALLLNILEGHINTEIATTDNNETDVNTINNINSRILFNFLAFDPSNITQHEIDGEFHRILEQTSTQPMQRRDNTNVTLPSYKYCEIPEAEGTKECPICCEKFTQDTKISILKCEHCFCHSCLTEWCHYKNNCPVCREIIPENN